MQTKINSKGISPSAPEVGGDRQATPVKMPGGSNRDLALVTAAHTETHAQTAVYAYLYPYIMQTLNFTVVELGALIAATSLVGGLLQGVHGWLSRWVKRKALCGGGNIFVGICLAFSSLATNFPLFGAARVAGGVAASPQHPVAASLMSEWYSSKKRGSAFSIHGSGGNVGTLVGPLVAGFLYLAIGWRDTLLVFAVPGIVVGSLVWIFLNDRRQPGTWFTPKEKAKRPSYLSAVRNTNALKLMIARAVTSVGRGLGIILTYVQLYFVKGLGLSHFVALGLFILLAAGSIFSPIVGGRLTDRIGLRRPVIVGSLVLSAVSLGLLIRAGHYIPALIISVLLLGFSVFNEGPISQALLSDIVSAQERDGAFSLYFVVSYSAASAWALVIAYIITSLSFSTAFEVIMVGNLVAAVIYFLIKENNFLREATLPKSPGITSS